MEHQKSEQLYTKIAIQLNDMIPEAWSKVYLSAEMEEGFRKIFFYYYPTGKQKPVSGFSIPELFDVPEVSYETMDDRLSDLVHSLWVAERENTEQVWSALTFIFDNEGKFTVEYGYEDVLERDMTQAKVVWEYKHLGLVPNSPYHKKLLDKFLETGEYDKI